MSRIRPSRFAVVAVAVATVSTLAACGGSSDGASPTVPATVASSPTMSVAVADNLASTGWDPVSAPSRTFRTLGPLVMGTLLRPGATPADAPVPNLAIKATANSTSKVWTITLRPGLTFTDGSALTAADFAFALKQGARSSALATRFGADSKGTFFTSASATSDTELVVTLRAPNKRLNRLVLAAPEFGCVKNNYGGASRADYFVKPVACGAYDIRDQGADAIALAKRPAYWNAAQVGPTELTVTSGPSASESVDVALVPRATTASGASPTASASQVVAGAPGRTLVLAMHASLPTRDVNLRQTIRFGLDRSAVATATGNGAVAADALTPPGFAGAVSIQGSDVDLQTAQVAVSLVPEARRSVTVLVDGQDDEEVVAATAAATSLNSLGLKVTVVKAEAAEYWTKLGSGNFQTAVVAVNDSVAEAAAVSGDWLITNGFGGEWPPGQLWAAFAHQVGAGAASTYTAATSEFERDVSDPAYAVPLITQPYAISTAPGVSGITVRIDGSVPLELAVIGR